MTFHPGSNSTSLRSALLKCRSDIRRDGGRRAGGKETLDDLPQRLGRSLTQHRDMGDLVEQEAVGGKVAGILQEHVLQLVVGCERTSPMVEAANLKVGDG